MPVANLFIERDLPFGPVEFKTITAELVDAWHESYRSRPPEQVSNFEAWVDRLRKDSQGLAAVSYTVEADDDYAEEQCLEKAEQAIALLRVLHPVNTSPYAVLYVRPLGSENIESYRAYHYKEGKFSGHSGQTRWPLSSPWVLSREALEGDRVLDGLIAIFAKKDRSDFEQRLFDALLVYSRNNISREAYEKLIFCLVAVESMLLRNTSEPIQDNIGDRMAYRLGRSPGERIEIVELVRRVYEIRSRFVHHGQQPTDMETLAQFMKRVQALFCGFILTRSEFETKDAMLEALRQRKYQ